MKIVKLRQLNEQELRHKLLELQKKLVAMKFAHKAKQLKNYSEMKYVRQDIARMETILHERSLLREFGTQDTTSSKQPTDQEKPKKSSPKPTKESTSNLQKKVKKPRKVRT